MKKFFIIIVILVSFVENGKKRKRTPNKPVAAPSTSDYQLRSDTSSEANIMDVNQLTEFIRKAFKNMNKQEILEGTFRLSIDALVLKRDPKELIELDSLHIAATIKKMIRLNFPHFPNDIIDKPHETDEDFQNIYDEMTDEQKEIFGMICIEFHLIAHIPTTKMTLHNLWITMAPNLLSDKFDNPNDAYKNAIFAPPFFEKFNQWFVRKHLKLVAFYNFDMPIKDALETTPMTKDTEQQPSTSGEEPPSTSGYRLRRRVAFKKKWTPKLTPVTKQSYDMDPAKLTEFIRKACDKLNHQDILKGTFEESIEEKLLNDDPYFLIEMDSLYISSIITKQIKKNFPRFPVGIIRKPHVSDSQIQKIYDEMSEVQKEILGMLFLEFQTIIIRIDYKTDLRSFWNYMAPNLIEQELDPQHVNFIFKLASQFFLKLNEWFVKKNEYLMLHYKFDMSIKDKLDSQRKVKVSRPKKRRLE